MILDPNNHELELPRTHWLRQQRPMPDGKPQLCLSDFIAPKKSGQIDYIGAFAVTTGHGIDGHVKAFEDAHDDYQAILLKALADRFAEVLQNTCIAVSVKSFGDTQRMSLYRTMS